MIPPCTYLHRVCVDFVCYQRLYEVKESKKIDAVWQCSCCQIFDGNEEHSSVHTNERATYIHCGPMRSSDMYLFSSGQAWKFYPTHDQTLWGHRHVSVYCRYRILFVAVPKVAILFGEWWTLPHNQDIFNPVSWKPARKFKIKVKLILNF